MKNIRRKSKKSTIFRMFLIPLIVIMLVQSMITIGTLIARRTGEMLQNYSGRMMSRLVENRKVILQNDMIQRWASVYLREELVNRHLEEFLESRDAKLQELLDSEEMQAEFLELLFPECIDVLQNNFTTGIFFILTEKDMEGVGEYSGFFIRDSDPSTNPVNYTDLLLERGSKHLSRKWNIPLDTNWTTNFHMNGPGQNDSDKFFYEPWRAGAEYPDADTEDLGYWALPFFLEKESADSHEMITYSFPLRHNGQVYGVMGVEIASRELYDYFPVEELNESRQSGYMLAVRGNDGRYMPLVGRGVLYDRIRSVNDPIMLSETDSYNLALVRDVKMNLQSIYAVVCPLKIYSNNVPYENTEWALLGLNTEEELFGMGRKLYFWMIVAVLFGLLFGVLGISVLVKHLTKPVQRLMTSISRGREGLQGYEASNILEVDALYDVVKDLTERQKEAENILLEEKERYRIALESSKDVFFSYNLKDHKLDIVNHKTMNGQWQCAEFESSFIDPECIYEADRAKAIQALQSRDDRLYTEFRLKWPVDSEFMWVALAGMTVYDTDGRRWKIIGSIRNIQEEKEREAQQLKRDNTDGATGLYTFQAGMEYISECRSVRRDGVMVSLFLDHLKETNEENGIVFGDMILEEIGTAIRSCIGEPAKGAECQAAMRLDSDWFVIWLEGRCREQAEALIGDLLARVRADFGSEKFNVDVYAGLVCAQWGRNTEELICMAKLAASRAAVGAAGQYRFYEDIPEKEHMPLPALQGRKVASMNFGEDVSLVSTALNLFGRGDNFPAQMTLMVRKIGRHYEADNVLVSILKEDFSSVYLEYQWHRDGSAAENVRKYKEEEKSIFFDWMGQKEVRYFSKNDSAQESIRRFLSVKEGQQGIMLPMYDSGNYMGNICILGIGQELLENQEEYQNLAELGSVIQSQINQQQSDIASKAKSEFLSRMSHEIRTPMNGIIGMTAIALQKDQEPERIVDCLQKIQSSSDYLLGLINDILDMSKIESGKMKLDPINFNMQEMLDTIRELILPQAQAKDIRFVRETELSHGWFVADKMRISQVLINLLGNAVKFTPEKGCVTLTVRELERTGDEIPVYFAVSDTGVGIAKEDQDRVFRSFEQASERNPAKQLGTGLGLSISSRLIQIMGSSIRLESEPGKGSRFSFTISLKPGESMETKVQEEEISFDGCHILVVEDNELNSEIARCLLEERNFEVDCVYDGEQAVERIRSTAPGEYDVILMDIMMPVMNGLDATRAIRNMEREDCHTIPIVAMSANAFDDDLKRSVECGMNGHLSKPVEVDKLYQTLSQVLNRK